MTAEFVALARLLQLALGSVLGFGCVYLGYRLFSQIPADVRSDGTFSFPKFGEVKLKAAPGIFFALFGAAVIYISLDRSIQITSNPPREPEQQASAAKNPPSTLNASGQTAPPTPAFNYSQQAPPGGFGYSKK